MSRLARLCLLLAAARAAHPQAQTTGAVSGKLVTESGQPLGGVTATYRRYQKRVATRGFHSQPAPGELAVAGSVTTRADGTFTVSGLPAGSYSLCLDTPPALYVDHCAWGLAAPSFTITRPATTAMPPVTIISGIRIHFLLTDPQAALPQGARLEPTAHVGVVTTKGVYHPATVVSHSSNVTEADITVPHSVTLSAWTFSRSLTFYQANASPTKLSPLAIPAGATDYSLAFTVSK